MNSQQLVTGLPPNLQNHVSQPCTQCVAAKSMKVAFKSQNSIDEESRSYEIGDEIHTDQVAPITPASRYGSIVVIEFIDRASRIGFMFGMKSLSEILDKFLVIPDIVEDPKELYNQVACL
jgi:hypothetical protein